MPVKEEDRQADKSSDSFDGIARNHTDEAFDGIIENSYFGKDPKQDDDYSSENLKNKEDYGTSAPTDASTNTSKSEKESLSKSGGFYNPKNENPRSGKSARGGFFRRKKLALATGISGIIITGFIGMLAYIPLQVAHIKEVFRGSYGGTQEATLLKRKMRLYNRAYFFKNDGEFDGFKQKGVFGFLKNRSSTKLINDLESKGFKVKADLTPEGRWTGKFSSIEYKGEVITSSSSSIWERRSAIRTALAEEYPTRGYMWRSKAARKVYKRYGLNRSAWWNDNAATRKIDAIEARFRSKVRDALNRKPAVDLGVDAPKSPTDENGDSTNPDQDKLNADEAASAKGELDANTKASIDADVNAAEPPNLVREVTQGFKEGAEDSPKKALEAAVSAGKKSVLGAIKITGAVEAACTGIKTLNQIESGSRTIKRLQLMKSFTVYMSLLDAVRTGNVDGKDVGAFMNLMTSKDPDTGKNAYQSGGWQWASKGKGKEPRYGNTFNTGGGTTGVLKKFRTTSYNLVGGPGSVEGTCDTVSNGFFQIGSAIVGIGAAIFSGGTFTAGNFAANFAISTAVDMIRSFATPLLTNLAAGTIVNGWEKGEKFGDMLSAASGSAYYAQGSQLGLRPLKKAEKTALMNEYNDLINDEQSTKPMYARLFDLSDTRSMLSVAVLNSPRSTSELAALAVNPLRVFFGKATAAEDGYECNDEEVVQNDIATDPFCNPILGETKLDSIDPIDNIKWMLNEKYIDDDGNPQGEYADYVKKCFENDNIETLFDVKDFTTTYNSTCTSSGENEKYSKFRAFHIDHNLLACMDKEIDQGHCDDSSASTSSSATTGTPGSFPGVSGLNCDGYLKITSQPAQISNGLPTNTTTIRYSSDIQNVCNQTKADCLNQVTGTKKALCAAYEFNDSWYGGATKTEGIPSNQYFYGLSQATNAVYNVTGWYASRKPGLNGYNLLECSALTTVAVYKAFGYSKAIGCSGNWGTRSHPDLFKQISWADVEPGDFLTYSQTCNLTSGYGHIAIAASKVDASGNFIVYEQSSFGTTAHFRKANTSTWGINAKKGINTFSGNISRWVGTGI